MGKKTLKSLKELDETFKKDSFEKFVKANSYERKQFLSAYGLKYQGKYKGVYKKKTDTALITDKENPFTGKTLEVRLVGNSSGFHDNETIFIKPELFTRIARIRIVTTIAYNIAFTQ